MTSQAVASVILKGSDEWFDWIDQVANYARQLHLWQFVDPNAVNRPPTPEEPREPVAPAPAPAPEAQPGEAPQAAPEPIPVSEEQLRAYDRALTLYRIDLSKWQLFVRNLAALDEYIVKSAIQTYANYVSGDTTAQKLTKLKNRLAPSDWAYEEEVRRKYQAAVGKNLEKGKVNLLAWTDEIEALLLKAQKIHLPEVVGTYPTKAILGAIKGANRTFWQYWVEEIERLQRQGLQDQVPDGFQMLDHFRRNCRFDSKTNTKEAPGSSFSTFQGKDENGQPSDSPGQSGSPGSSDSGNQSSRNKREIECCERNHRGGYNKCFYLYLWKRLDYWKP